jgi:phage terminase Nu1 subunit (DNA packaging protein)
MHYTPARKSGQTANIFGIENVATQRELAKHLGTNEHRIRDLNRLEILTPPRGRAGYELDVARIEYIRYLEGQIKDQELGYTFERNEDQMSARIKNEDSLLEEKARLAAEQAEKVALDNKQRKGELAPIAVLEDYAAQVAGQVRASLESLPAQIKREIAHLRASEIAIIRREVTRASDNIADFEPSHPNAT